MTAPYCERITWRPRTNPKGRVHACTPEEGEEECAGCVARRAAVAEEDRRNVELMREEWNHHADTPLRDHIRDDLSGRNGLAAKRAWFRSKELAAFELSEEFGGDEEAIAAIRANVDGRFTDDHFQETIADFIRDLPLNLYERAARRASGNGR